MAVAASRNPESTKSIMAAGGIDGSVEVAPTTLDTNVGPIDTPGLVGWFEMTAQPLLQFGTVALDPAPDCRGVRLQAALAEQLFDIAERERVPKGPAHGAKNQLGLRLPPLEDRRSDGLLHDLFRLPAAGGQSCNTTFIARKVCYRRVCRAGFPDCKGASEPEAPAPQLISWTERRDELDGGYRSFWCCGESLRPFGRPNGDPGRFVAFLGRTSNSDARQSNSGEQRRASRQWSSDTGYHSNETLADLKAAGAAALFRAPLRRLCDLYRLSETLPDAPHADFAEEGLFTARPEYPLIHMTVAASASGC